MWFATGIYFVGAYEQGIVLRFGRYVARTPPGMNYHLPWPIETAYTLDVTHQRQINIGYKAPEDENSGVSEDIPAEAEMLTGDENIIDINFTVYWVVKDAGAFLFNVESRPIRPIPPTRPSRPSRKARCARWWGAASSRTSSPRTANRSRSRSAS
ncbi:MAG: SPFH domain-containing protein [Rhizomicrobium sp.]